MDSQEEPSEMTVSSQSPVSFLDKETFSTYFHQEYSMLQEELKSLESSKSDMRTKKKAIENILRKITKLSNEVSDAHEHNNSYDQRAYSKAIKTLEETLVKIQSKMDPKHKFRFKTKMPNNLTVCSDKSGALSSFSLFESSQTKRSDTVSDDSSLDTLAKAENVDCQTSPFNNSNNINNSAEPSRVAVTSSESSFCQGTDNNLSNYENQLIIFPSNTSRGFSSSITRLRGCIVTPYSLTSQDHYFGLSIAEVKSSLIVTGQVAGAAHITGAEDSVFVVKARQVRLHDCKNLIIYLYCTSRPIIENCTNIEFSPLPSLYMPTVQELDRNKWDQVDDFKWLKSSASPNWGILPEEKRLGESIWNELHDGNELEIHDILKKIGVEKL